MSQITYQTAMAKTATLTTGQKHLLLFLLLTGGGAGAGAYLDKDKRGRGAMIGGMAGSMGHVATFLRPQTLDKMDRESKAILSGTGAVAGTAMGGFLGKNLYSTYEGVMNENPALSNALTVEKTAAEQWAEAGWGMVKTAHPGAGPHTHSSNQPMQAPEKGSWGEDWQAMKEFSPKDIVSPAEGVNVLAKKSVGADIDKTWGENAGDFVNDRVVQPIKNIATDTVDKVKAAGGEGLAKWGPIALGGLGLLGGGWLLKDMLFGNKGQQPSQYAFGAPAYRGPTNPFRGGGPGSQWSAPPINWNQWKTG